MREFWIEFSQKRIDLFKSINLDDITFIAKEAGKMIMEVYSHDFDVEYKADNSPLTQADKLSNEFICSSLIHLYPGIPIISEENKQIPYQDRNGWEYFWCIDPIDGTKEFINKNGEFTVNIALIHKDTPVLGVVYAPAIDVLYTAKKGSGAFKNGAKLPLEQDRETYDIVTSKSHLSKKTKEYIESIKTDKVKKTKSIGSSLKICMVAEGAADIYPRLGPTMEWDTAAAHAIVIESGKGIVRFEDSKPLVYNKPDLLNPWFIVK